MQESEPFFEIEHSVKPQNENIPLVYVPEHNITVRTNETDPFVIRYLAGRRGINIPRDNYFGMENMGISRGELANGVLNQFVRGAKTSLISGSMSLYRAAKGFGGSALDIVIRETELERIEGERKQELNNLREAYFNKEISEEEYKAKIKPLRADSPEFLAKTKVIHEKFLEADRVSAEQFKRLKNANEEWLNKTGLSKTGRDGFVYDLAAGAASLAQSIGIYALTKTPAAAGLVFGAITGRDDYEEALENGLSREKAASIGLWTGAASVVLEEFGVANIIKPLKNAGIIKHAARSILTEGSEEFFQNIADDFIMTNFGGRQKEVAEIIIEAIEAGVIGGLTGGFAGGVRGALPLLVSETSVPVEHKPSAKAVESVEEVKTAAEAVKPGEEDSKPVKPAAEDISVVKNSSYLQNLARNKAVKELIAIGMERKPAEYFADKAMEEAADIVSNTVPQILDHELNENTFEGQKEAIAKELRSVIENLGKERPLNKEFRAELEVIYNEQLEKGKAAGLDDVQAEYMARWQRARMALYSRYSGLSPKYLSEQNEIVIKDERSAADRQNGIELSQPPINGENAVYGPSIQEFFSPIYEVGKQEYINELHRVYETKTKSTEADRKVLALVGGVPDILCHCGIENKNMYISRLAIRKAIGDLTADELSKNTALHNHNLTWKILEDLPELLADPIAVYKDRKEYIVVLNRTVKIDGKETSLVAAISVSRYSDGHAIVLSAYGRRNIERKLQEAINTGNILYFDRNQKAQIKGAHASHLPLPRLSITSSIPSKEDIVKRYSLTEGKAYYQGNRGSIEFKRSDVNDGSVLITLLKDADASTLPHELAHLFLLDMQRMAKLSPDGRLKGMLEDLRQSISEPEEYNGVYSVEQQEKFAKLYERYLYEGKAPTKAWQKLFIVFKDWLHSIYKSVKDLPELSAAAKSLFDKWLSYDDVGNIPTAEQIKEYGSKIYELREVIKGIKEHKEISVNGVGVEDVKGILNVTRMDRPADVNEPLIEILKKTGIDYKKTNIEPEILKKASIKDVVGEELAQKLEENGYIELNADSPEEEVALNKQAEEIVTRALTGEEVYRIGEAEWAGHNKNYRDSLAIADKLTAGQEEVESILDAISDMEFNGVRQLDARDVAMFDEAIAKLESISDENVKDSLHSGVSENDAKNNGITLSQPPIMEYLRSQPYNKVNVVVLKNTGSKLSVRKILKDLIKNGKEVKTLDNFTAKFVTNIRRFGSRNISVFNHLQKSSFKDRNANNRPLFITNIEQLLSNSFLVEIDKAKQDKYEHDIYCRFYAAVAIDNDPKSKIYPVRISALHRKDASTIYNVEVYDLVTESSIEKQERHQPRIQSLTSGHGVVAEMPLEVSLIDLLGKVKGTDKREYSKDFDVYQKTEVGYIQFPKDFLYELTSRKSDIEKNNDNTTLYQSGLGKTHYADVTNKSVKPIEIPKGAIPKFESTKELKDWILRQLDLIGKISVKDNGREVQFSKSNIGRSLKGAIRSSQEVKRQSYFGLRDIVESAVYGGWRESDERHPNVKGQELYYNAFVYDGKEYGLELYVDIPSIKNSAYLYAGHNIKETGATSTWGSKNEPPEPSGNAPVTASIPEIQELFKPEVLFQGIADKAEAYKHNREEYAFAFKPNPDIKVAIGNINTVINHLIKEIEVRRIDEATKGEILKTLRSAIGYKGYLTRVRQARSMIDNAVRLSSGAYDNFSSLKRKPEYTAEKGERLKAVWSNTEVQAEIERKAGISNHINWDWVRDIGQSVSDRAGAISPRLKLALREFSRNFNIERTKHVKALEPFMKAYEAMAEEDKHLFDWGAFNGNEEVINSLSAKYAELEPSLKEYRKVLDEIYVQAAEVGFEVGYIQNYFPRKVKNYEEFNTYMQGTKEWTRIECWLKKELNKVDPDKWIKAPEHAEELAEMINRYYNSTSNRGSGVSKPGNIKPRQIFEITPDMTYFYYGSGESAAMYASEMDRAIQVRKFFGYDLNNEEDSIGMVILDIKSERAVAHAQDPSVELVSYEEEKELRRLVEAFMHPKGPNGFWQGIKDLGYIATLISPVSTLTQLEDLSVSFAENGIGRTMKSLFGKKLKLEDIGVEIYDVDINVNMRATQAILNKALKLVFFDKADKLGKETFILADFNKRVEQVRKKKAEFISECELYGYTAEEIANMADSFAKGDIDDINENVKSLLFYDLAEVQPIDMAEMPIHYLRGGWWRIAYALKTFTLKRLNYLVKKFNKKIMRGKSLWIKGDKVGARKEWLSGIGEMSITMFLLVSAGASLDWLKDWIFGRQSDIPSLVADNILKQAAFNRWEIKRIARDGIADVIIAKIYPPVLAMAQDVLTDSQRVYNDKLEVKDMRIWNNVPVIGRFYYWWFGGGKLITEKDKAKKGKRTKVKKGAQQRNDK